MSTHKTIDRICVIAIVIALLLTILCMNGEALGILVADNTMGYESRLFDASKVHTIDIVMDDWDSFISSAQREEYSVCTVIIDGDAYSNVGIRGKGNTSLSTVSSMDSDRYSFKIEFDQYDSTKSYYGLDKLSLNNIIQDTTYMKDYLTYQLMGQFGVAAPLCSYVYITVNGEDWGLYLAVEAIEDGFLQRNYGTDHGELYKPDSMSFGGGRGNGMDFNMEDFMNSFEEGIADDTGSAETSSPTVPDMPQNEQMPGDFAGPNGGETQEVPGRDVSEDFDPSSIFGEDRSNSENRGNMGDGMSMGSSDVKLQYIDYDPDSYSNIFNNAKTDITTADQTRLIESLKALSSGENIESVVDIEQVIRYFVVHNFVVNGDSYTGSMIHNYYLYEKDGQLSMIPWDYNLAFGTFQGGDAASAVNDPIDSPLSVSGSDRPMIDWIFASEDYTELYHRYFAEFLENVDFAALIDAASELIAPYVEKDPTAFYSYEEFEAGVAALREFCLLREESIIGQLNGTIPSTDEGQSADSATLVDAAHLTISDMGSMGDMGGGGFGSENQGDRFQNTQGTEEGNFTPPGTTEAGNFTSPGTTEAGDFTPPGTTEAGDFTPPGTTEPGNFTPPGTTEAGDFTAPGTTVPTGSAQTDDTQTAPLGDANSMPDQQSSNGMETTDSVQSQQFTEGQQMPGDMTNRPSANTDSGFQSEDFSGSIPGTVNQSQSEGGKSWILLSASIAVLLFGLIVAFKFKR